MGRETFKEYQKSIDKTPSLGGSISYRGGSVLDTEQDEEESYTLHKEKRVEVGLF